MAKKQILTAVESKKDIRQAVDTWESKLSVGATIFDGLSGKVYWHQSLGVWGHFYKGFTEGKTPGNYWNVFGRVPHRFRKNMIVEINPPGAGINTNVQGVIAVDADGKRWALHQGRLHPSGVRITEEMFDAATSMERVSVRFSNTEVVEYYKVANIDAPPQVLQTQVASYVAQCSRVRVYYIAGEKAAQEEANVEAAEGASSPEKQGSYQVGAQGPKMVERRHADVWHALTKVLDERQIKHSNARVGRHGPDLRTFGKSPILFEIKSDSTATDLQRGVGQLLLYEQLLGSTHRKILVIPGPPEVAMGKAIKGLGLGELHYRRKGRTIRFSTQDLTKLLS